MDVFGIFSLLGGLALFLFGMDVMGKSLEKQAGGSLQKLLSRMTGSPLRGFLLGLAVTAVIQSSSATTVMVVGFVNSGIMQLHQAVGVILGSNVGTTVTAWLLSLSGLQGDSLFIRLLKPTSFSPVLAFIGILLRMTGRSEKRKGAGTILLGFAVLMTGMSAMSDAVAPLQDAPWFTNLFIKFSNPILGLLVGAILTAIIQSSSASVGILQAFAATGAITYSSAIPIILGQNIGTCVTALLSAVGANRNAKRAAMVHLYFNIIGSLLFMTIFYSLNAVIHFSIMGESINAMGIAVIHTSFNLAATAVMLPFSRFLEKLAIRTIPDDKAPEQFQLLDPRLLATPAAAVERTFLVACDMALISQESLDGAMKLRSGWDAKLSDSVRRQEEATDRYEDSIGSYLVQLSSKNLTQKDSRLVSMLLHTLSDFERLGDHALNMAKTAQEIHEKKIIFSAAARQELSVLERAIHDIVKLTVDVFTAKDPETARRVEPMQQVVSDLVRQIKAHHIDRLASGSCSISYGFVLEDLLTASERVADHCSNIAVALIEMPQGSYDSHEYLSSVKRNSDEFELYYAGYRSRYLLGEDTSNSAN
ncbi:MAG: Na/Pi cotransporter family protein [Pygmaiobacter massiliensis]|nr:Na/Pi cotransporter family protein [Pygmaiobacter massiliensis]